MDVNGVYKPSYDWGGGHPAPIIYNLKNQVVCLGMFGKSKNIAIEFMPILDSLTLTIN